MPRSNGTIEAPNIRGDLLRRGCTPSGVSGREPPGDNKSHKTYTVWLICVQKCSLVSINGVYMHIKLVMATNRSVLNWIINKTYQNPSKSKPQPYQNFMGSWLPVMARNDAPSWSASRGMKVLAAMNRDSMLDVATFIEETRNSYICSHSWSASGTYDVMLPWHHNIDGTIFISCNYGASINQYPNTGT